MKTKYAHGPIPARVPRRHGPPCCTNTETYFIPTPHQSHTNPTPTPHQSHTNRTPTPHKSQTNPTPTPHQSDQNCQRKNTAKYAKKLFSGAPTTPRQPHANPAPTPRQPHTILTPTPHRSHTNPAPIPHLCQKKTSTNTTPITNQCHARELNLRSFSSQNTHYCKVKNTQLKFRCGAIAWDGY